MKKIDFELEFQTKIGFPLAPLLAPVYKFEEYGLSAFSEKKINVVACFDGFLAWLTVRLPYLAG